MASDPNKTVQSVRHGPHSQVRHARPDPAVSIDHTAAGRCRPSAGLPGLDTTNKHSVASWEKQRTAPTATWTRTLATTAFYKALMVGPIQPHLASVDRRPTSDPAIPHLVSVNCRPTSNPAVVVNPSFACRPPDGFPGMAFTDKQYVASWTQPHTAQATTFSAYNLTPTPVAWSRSYDPAGLPGLGWAQPRIAPATTTAGYNLLPTFRILRCHCHSQPHGLGQPLRPGGP